MLLGCASFLLKSCLVIYSSSKHLLHTFYVSHIMCLLGLKDIKKTQTLFSRSSQSRKLVYSIFLRRTTAWCCLFQIKIENMLFLFSLFLSCLPVMLTFQSAAVISFQASTSGYFYFYSSQGTYPPWCLPSSLLFRSWWLAPKDKVFFTEASGPLISKLLLSSLPFQTHFLYTKHILFKKHTFRSAFLLWSLFTNCIDQGYLIFWKRCVSACVLKPPSHLEEFYKFLLSLPRLNEGCLDRREIHVLRDLMTFSKGSVLKAEKKSIHYNPPSFPQRKTRWMCSYFPKVVDICSLSLWSIICCW